MKCPQCEGSGSHYNICDQGHYGSKTACSMCGGTGDIEEQTGTPIGRVDGMPIRGTPVATGSTALAIENNKLKARLATLEAALAEARKQLNIEQVLVYSIVTTLGGLVEGAPTQRLNVLQRCRKLVATESAALAAAKKEAPDD